jgi:hypothetical protein
MGECVAHEVNPAPLPGGGKDLGNGGFDALWASDTTSLTPHRPRRVSLRRNSIQIGSAPEVPISKPSTSRRPSVLTPMGMIMSLGS